MMRGSTTPTLGWSWAAGMSVHGRGGSVTRSSSGTRPTRTRMIPGRRSGAADEQRDGVVGTPRRDHDRAMRFLVACLREPDGMSVGQVESMRSGIATETILKLAAFHRVDGLAYEALLSALGPDDALVDRLGLAYGAAVRSHLAALWALAQLQPALEATGARWAVIKGPALAEPLYGAPGRRPYADLDLLVQPAAFRDVLDTLDASGASLLDRNWRVLRRDLRGELHMRSQRGVPLDVHWNVVNMYRRRTMIDTDELLSRSIAL